MSTIELEAQKAGLAREILCMDDEDLINNIRLLLIDNHLFISKQETPEKRQLGILNGKASIVFNNDFEMTTEELLGMV
jgi:hypothetical protein